MFRLLVLTTLSIALPAQTPTLKTHGIIGLSLDVKTPYSVTPHYRSIAANTPINGVSSLRLAVGSLYNPGWMTTTVRAYPGPRSSTLIFEERAQISMGSATSLRRVSTAKAAPKQVHEWLLTVPGNSSGNLFRFTAENIFVRNGAIAIDFGNNGKLDVLHDMRNGTLKGSRKLGTKTIDVRILTYGAIDWTGWGDYSFALGITLNPRKAIKYTDFSPHCGIKLTATDTLDDFGHHFLLVADGAFPNNPMLLGIGLQKTSIPLPGSACVLRINPLILIANRANAQGQWRIHGSLLPALFGKHYIQVFGLYSKWGVTSIRGSNGIEGDAGK